MDALEKMSLAELRGQLSMTPWFAAAHIELVRRVSAIGPGVGSEFEKAALNVWSRAALYRIVNEASGKRDFTDADITEAIRAGLNAGKEDNGTWEGRTAGQSENVPGGSRFAQGGRQNLFPSGKKRRNRRDGGRAGTRISGQTIRRHAFLYRNAGGNLCRTGIF